MQFKGMEIAFRRERLWLGCDDAESLQVSDKHCMWSHSLIRAQCLHLTAYQLKFQWLANSRTHPTYHVPSLSAKAFPWCCGGWASADGKKLHFLRLWGLRHVPVWSWDSRTMETIGEDDLFIYYNRQQWCFSKIAICFPMQKGKASLIYNVIEFLHRYYWLRREVNFYITDCWHSWHREHLHH